MPQPYKFTPAVRERYLNALRRGKLKYRAAEMAGVTMKTIKRHRKADQEFAEDERLAFQEGLEGVEQVIMDLARAGDLSAGKFVLQAHKPEVYADKKTIAVEGKIVHEIDATNRRERVSSLRADLQERVNTLEAAKNPDNEIIDAEIVE